MTTALNHLKDHLERTQWLDWLERLALPILEPLAAAKLRATMPVEPAVGDHGSNTHLQAFGRLLCGLAPWLETGAGARHDRLLNLTRQSLAVAVDPGSPDFLNFNQGRQPVVDAAFLAEGLLRAPTRLIDALDPTTRQRLIAALRSSRQCHPAFNNWLLFAATIEAALFRLGDATWDVMRVDYALRQHDQWYVGDGHYSDGPVFHFDYYNSLVIHPMLVDVIRTLQGHEYNNEWAVLEPKILARAQRYAGLLERMIGADGMMPPVGRSLAYRCGVLHALAQAALIGNLPENLPPAQVRSAMTAVIERMLGASGTFDERGYLRIGFCGAQPGMGESYISTGSLYLCAAAFLPLGLGGEHAFWSAAPLPWTQVRVRNGEDIGLDKAVDWR